MVSSCVSSSSRTPVGRSYHTLAFPCSTPDDEKKKQEDFFSFSKSHDTDVTSRILRTADSLSITSDLKTVRVEPEHGGKNVTFPLLLLLR